MTAYRDVVLASNPVAYYRLGEPGNAGGTTAKDSSSSGHDATYTTATADSRLIWNDLNTSAHTTTSSLIATVSGSWIPFQGTYSVEMILKANNVTGTVQAPFGQFSGTVASLVLVHYNAVSSVGDAGNISWYTDSGGADGNAIVLSQSSSAGLKGIFKDGNPHHVVFVRETIFSVTRKTIYFDADVAISAPELGGGPGNPGSALQIGNGGNSSATRGYQSAMSDFAVYNKALTAGEVLSHFLAFRGLGATQVGYRKPVRERGRAGR